MSSGRDNRCISSGRTNQLQLFIQSVNDHELKTIVTHINITITKMFT